MLLGNFRYCSSSSESEDAEDGSDTSSKSEGYLEKLTAQKKALEDKLRERDNRLDEIQKTLKLLSERRRSLFAKRDEMKRLLIPMDSGRMFLNGENRKESEEHILPSPSMEPLNLDPHVQFNDNEEEFDSDDE